MTLEEIKNYLRIDYNNDDNLIQSLITAARSLVEEKTGKTYKPDSELWNLCIKLLVAHWYENRHVEQSQRTNPVGFTVDALVKHISVSQEHE